MPILSFPPPVVALDLSVGGILNLLSPVAVYIAIILIALVLFGAIRGWVVAAGETWGLVGVFTVLFLVGIVLVVLGAGLFGWAITGLALFFLIVSGISSKRNRQAGTRGG